jgi:hypothetical protein
MIIQFQTGMFITPDQTWLHGNRKAAANSTFAIGGVSCSADSFVVAESSVLRINICSKKPAHRKSANRCTQCPNLIFNGLIPFSFFILRPNSQLILSSILHLIKKYLIATD